MSLAAEHKRSVPRSSTSSNTLLQRTLVRNLSTRSDSSSIKPKHSQLSILAHVLSPTAIVNTGAETKRPSGLALSQYSSERKKKKKVKSIRHGPSCFALQHKPLSRPSKVTQIAETLTGQAMVLEPTINPGSEKGALRKQRNSSQTTLARAFKEINRLKRELEIKELELQRLKKLNQLRQNQGPPSSSRERQTANPKKRVPSEMSDLAQFKENLFWTTYKSPGREEKSGKKISPSRRYAGQYNQASLVWLGENKENLSTWRNMAEEGEEEAERKEPELKPRGDLSWLCQYEISPER